MSEDEIIMTLRSTQPRRWGGILAQFVLGLVLFAFVFAQGLSPVMRLFFMLLGGSTRKKQPM